MNRLLRLTSSFRYGSERCELDMEKIAADSSCAAVTTRDGLIEAKAELKTYDGDAYEWVVRYTNIGSQNSCQLTEINGLDLFWPCCTDESLIFESLRGDSCGGDSFLPIREELSGMQPFHLEPTGGRPSNTTAFPYFDLHNANRRLVCAIGWSGQWRLDISRESDGFRIRAGLQDADFYLKPGESARSPRILLMIREGNGDIGDLRRAFRQLELLHYSPRQSFGPDFRVPIACQNFDRYFWNSVPLTGGQQWATEQIQLENIAFAAKCGFDHYWLDACWFKNGFVKGGVGNYIYDAGFPNGLRPLADQIHASGMRFIVWFEPERVQPGTEVDTEHPEWLLIPDDPAKERRLFNLSIPEAAAWLFDKIAQVIEESSIDFYRQDFNIDPLPFWRRADEPGRRGFTENQYVEALYTLWDKLHARFPRMPIDNCSSGGRRIDLETCIRSVPLWRSDTGCSASSPESPSCIWNQNQTLGLSRYLAYQSIASWLPDTNEFRSAMTMGIACDFDAFNPDFNFAQARASIDEIRSLQKDWEGDFYGLTEPSLDPAVWTAYQLHN
ncbi:MAG TPA: hypothetical protein DD640_08060, partial [Clostridiales bacterium]|nr:hypothetical protein [Clostridiales bacterium]